MRIGCLCDEPLPGTACEIGILKQRLEPLEGARKVTWTAWLSPRPHALWHLHLRHSLPSEWKVIRLSGWAAVIELPDAGQVGHLHALISDANEDFANGLAALTQWQQDYATFLAEQPPAMAKRTAPPSSPASTTPREGEYRVTLLAGPDLRLDHPDNFALICSSREWRRVLSAGARIPFDSLEARCPGPIPERDYRMVHCEGQVAPLSAIFSDRGDRFCLEIGRPREPDGATEPQLVASRFSRAPIKALRWELDDYDEGGELAGYLHLDSEPDEVWLEAFCSIVGALAEIDVFGRRRLGVRVMNKDVGALSHALQRANEITGRTSPGASPDGMLGHSAPGAGRDTRPRVCRRAMSALVFPKW